ncbi:HIG1 domain family member 1A, mitochondrial isoform X2 [Folsomia candida]|uniref:HIG1 domain family member 1A, mitochondrial isoform X2 n=1 Tax=Folsomia candida TaxID=158441 RepID=UPI000B8EF841|nr:HIG1 domain family member 1A, mitochondrial isoform X2 [Folsomia candida]
MSKQGDERLDFRSSYDDTEKSKFISKAKENPFVPAGIGGALFALAYAAFKFKNRGDQKVSVFLIHTRVAAQGAVVGALTVGCIYQIFQEFIWNKKK